MGAPTCFTPAYFTPTENLTVDVDMTALTALDDKWYYHVRNLEIEITTCSWHIPPKERSDEGDFEDIEPVLAGFPHLKKITLTWESYMKETLAVFESGTAWILPEPLPPQLHRERVLVLHMMHNFRSFEISHPGVKITVQRPARSLTYEQKTDSQGQNMSVGDYMWALDAAYWKAEALLLQLS